VEGGFCELRHNGVLGSSAKGGSPKSEATLRLVCLWATLELSSTKGSYGLLVQ
jgi:hypothetical protein